MKDQGHCQYTKDDILQAFDMGLDSGLYVLEKSIGLPLEDRKYLLKCLKRMIESKTSLHNHQYPTGVA